MRIREIGWSRQLAKPAGQCKNIRMGDALLSARAPVREPRARRARLQASRTERPLPDAVDHGSNRRWDGRLQLDVSPLTLHQAPCGAVDARDHRVAESRYAVVARPAVCRPDQARRSLPLHPEDRYEARRAGLQLAGPREVPLPMSGRTIGPLTRQLTPADRGYRTCAALGRAPGTRDQAYGKSLAAPASCRGRGASAPGPAPAPGP